MNNINITTPELTVATTILAQLGGRRFAALTGAKSFSGTGQTLSFRLPARFAKDGIRVVRITLDASDTYTMEFIALRTVGGLLGARVVAQESSVYADQLQAVFTSATGLDTHL